MATSEHAPPRIGISSCLLGENVRHDGHHRRDPFLTETLGPLVVWEPVCPELEVGMGVPRETVRLEIHGSETAMIAPRSGKDWTDPMKAFARKRVQELKKKDLHGFIFKKDSPSCGMERVRVSVPGKKGAPGRTGRGLFAAVLMDHWPLLPVEEEGRLNDPRLRENFIERVFGYKRWSDFSAGRRSARALEIFHRRHKFLLMAHSDAHLRRLGRLVAGAKRDIAETYRDYGKVFMEGLSVLSTRKKQTNVLEHLQGFVSDHLDKNERGELTGLIKDYHRGLYP
ncbi:MAG TPA: DUF523 and DUF1722 domain-containing protein, partial [Nitrospiria bacterium]|nr:DUF523 and DUF1722 domain-containing protein [Nitrospiria bacterium]